MSIIITVSNDSEKETALVKTWMSKDEGREFLPNGEETIAPKGRSTFVVNKNKSIEVIFLPKQNGAA